jgi:hypothetical protein
LRRLASTLTALLDSKGLLVRDEESNYLTMDGQHDNVMNQLQSHSITYRVVAGPQQGLKAFTLQAILAWKYEEDFGKNQVGKIAGFSLQTGVGSKTRDRKKLE